MNFVEELRWRGLLHDMTPGIEELLLNEKVKGYIGFDPTAESLTIGNMVTVMLLRHFQRAGHVPVALVGGATGMVGDPSGKKSERKLLDEATLNRNIAKTRQQLAKFLDFEASENPAQLVNNYDWFSNMGVLDFLRDIGKHLTVNYMMAKDSVKTRLKTGISFTEFSYQLIQGYDFVHLNQQHGCKLQMGGSDQWGNITAGTELLRRMHGKEAYAITCPLLTKEDGTKFGKSEAGNIWLDPTMTSPYQFYQFWINATDADAKKYIRIFTFLDKDTIEALEAEHAQAPHRNLLQKRVAAEITHLIHGQEALDLAIEASQILFGKGTKDTLLKMSKNDILDVFSGVPQFTVSRANIASNIPILDFLATNTTIYASKGEARRALKGGAVRINKEVIKDLNYTINTKDLLNEDFVIVQKGKRKYNLVKLI